MNIMAKEIKSFICNDSSCEYRLIVGTDSEGIKKPSFVTAIIVLRVGRGGRYFWKKTNNGSIYHTLRDRIYNEVNLSLATAQEIINCLNRASRNDDYLKYDFQIHIDVGRKGPTREMVKEVVGMVQGNGFEARIKPESFAASNVADKYA